MDNETLLFLGSHLSLLVAAGCLSERFASCDG